MSKYGPTRGEHVFRLVASLAGLCLLGFALWLKGAEAGPAMMEVVGVGGAFLLGSAGWSGWKLLKMQGKDG